MLQTVQQVAENLGPATYKFNFIPRAIGKSSQNNKLLLRREHFVDAKQEVNSLLSKKATRFFEKSPININNITEDQVELFYGKENLTSVRVKDFLACALNFVNLNQGILKSSRLTTKIDVKQYNESSIRDVKNLLIKKVIENGMLLSREEWMIKFIADRSSKTYSANTPWYLTSSIINGKVTLICKEDGLIKFKEVVLTSSVSCRIVFVIRDSHLADFVIH